MMGPVRYKMSQRPYCAEAAGLPSPHSDQQQPDSTHSQIPKAEAALMNQALVQVTSFRPYLPLPHPNLAHMAALQAPLPSPVRCSWVRSLFPTTTVMDIGECERDHYVL
jgi:hypothetical protein